MSITLLFTKFDPVDYTQCKRNGESYYALPTRYMFPKCSGRDALCKEVLNDKWYCYPGWSGGGQTNKKNPFLDVLSSCEDEMFEVSNARFYPVDDANANT